MEISLLGKLGLRLRGHHLLWCNEGWGLNWPYWIKEVIITVFNTVSCILLGHDRTMERIFEEEFDDRDTFVCTACCRILKREVFFA
jgi:hypothetical protein